MKPYSFLQGIDAGKLPPEAENYLREEILKSEAIGQISPDAKEFKNVVELITSRYPDALPKGESEKEVKGVTKEDYQKAIKGLAASIKYLPAGDKKKTQAAIKGLKIAMKYQKMEKGGSMEKGGGVGEFIRKIKSEKGHILDKIKTAKGDTMIYYREYGSSPTDVKTKVFSSGGSMAGGVITAEQIWDGWTYNERHNFLKNHNLFPTFYTSDYEYIFNTANSKDTMPDYRVNQIRHAKEVVDTLDKHTSGGSKEKGGGIGDKKTWIVNISMPGERAGDFHLRKEEIVLGRMSDEFDVQQAIKRKTPDWLGNGRILSIYQKMEKGGGMAKGRKVWEYEVYDNGEWRKASQKDFKYWYDEFGAEVMDRFGKEHKKGEIPFSEVENIYNPQGYEVARKTKIEKSSGGSNAGK